MADLNIKTMSNIKFQGNTYSGNTEESILDTFLRLGVEVPYSCRSAVCNGCRLKLVKGDVAKKSSCSSCKTSADGNILACNSIPFGDIEVDLADGTEEYSRASVIEKNLLAPDICQLKMVQDKFFCYEPGQVINLKFPGESEFRSYSLASLFSEDEFLEIHVKRVPNGKFSNLIFDQVKVGDEVEIRQDAKLVSPSYYKPEQKMLFIANGTGLAPIQAIIKYLLHENHTGDLLLYHGSRHPEGLYMDEELHKLQQEYPNFKYNPCLSGSNVLEGFREGRAHVVAFKDCTDLSDFKVYLCGLPQMVSAATVVVTKAGVNDEDIFTDPYQTSHRVTDSKTEVDYEITEEEPFYPEPDMEMWNALIKDDLLNKILTDFYVDAFQDSRLGGFFKGFTTDRLIQKQYNFLYQLLTGEKVYFGSRPRNAHHWMVISDELFDYREDLLFYHARKHGLAEHLIDRLRKMDEIFRNRMVKDKPWPKILEGTTYPLEGYEEIELDTSGLCDSCHNEIESGTKVKYHIRHAEIYCPECAELEVVKV